MNVYKPNFMIRPTSISLRNTLECINSYHDDLIHTMPITVLNEINFQV